MGDATGHPDLPETITCTHCGRAIAEDEAQAEGWGYWRVVGGLYPFCPGCAEREFGTGTRAAPTD